MKRWSEFELLILVGVVALAVSFFHSHELSGSETPPVTVLSQRDLSEWEHHYERAQRAIQEREFVFAEGELLEAERISRSFPAHDDRLAESLDDLGLVYFSLSKPKLAMQAQGRAVSALLLAKGPSASELSIYIERYGWARQRVQDASSTNPENPYDFLRAYDPGLPKWRYEREMGKLLEDYQELGDQGALEALR